REAARRVAPGLCEGGVRRDRRDVDARGAFAVAVVLGGGGEGSGGGRSDRARGAELRARAAGRARARAAARSGGCRCGVRRVRAARRALREDAVPVREGSREGRGWRGGVPAV